MRKKFAPVLTALIMTASLTACAGSGEQGLTLSDENFVIKDGVLRSYNGSGGEVEIPEGVTTVGQLAFRRSELTGVLIPDGVETLEKMAFGECKGLTHVDIPNTVKSIGESAFFACDDLDTITLPDSITDIGNNAFFGCDSLLSITIPENVTAISYMTFGS